GGSGFGSTAEARCHPAFQPADADQLPRVVQLHGDFSHWSQESLCFRESTQAAEVDDGRISLLPQELAITNVGEACHLLESRESTLVVLKELKSVGFVDRQGSFRLIRPC